ncbi:hypothetical protein ACIBSW_14400 [Actinoplanes sp. NPDC049668]|uniref:hypothetical protein n=1 Tax=unclassified Actinoplanes TaxID=2626549 RepID=UPI0033BE6BC8
MTNPDPVPPTDSGPPPWQPPPAPQGFHPPAFAPAPPPRKKSFLPWLIAGGVAVVLLLCGGIGVAVTVAANRIEAEANRPLSAWEEEQARRAQQDPVPDLPEELEEAEPVVTPAASDFKLTPKITGRQCFGSAGCNIKFKVKMAYTGPALSETDTWAVTYEVSGVEDGPMIGTFEVSGERYNADEELTHTSGPKKKLTIKVTDIERVGF